MSVDSLYQEIILDHYKHPRGKGPLDSPLAQSHQVNPTCGDEVTVDVSGDAHSVHIGYEGQGCSISQASASVMSEMVNGASIDTITEKRRAFVELMHAKGQGVPDEEMLEDGVAFAGVAKYPARVKCALLPWVALQDAAIKAGIAHEENA